jgi:DNA recombination protein RmuC
MIVEALLVLILAALLLIIWKIFKSDKDSRTLALLEEKHRQMLVDVNDSLNKLSDRFNKTVTDELTATRESLQKLQLSQQESLSKIREDVIDKLHKTLFGTGKRSTRKFTKFFKKYFSSANEVVGKFNEIGG